MLLRVFAVIDDSEIGLACLEWVQFMLALDMPLRIASATGAAEIMGDRAGRSPNPWARVRSFFATPLEDQYVNVVMSPINTWDRFWAARARRNVAIVASSSLWPGASSAKRPFDATVISGELAAANYHAATKLANQWADGPYRGHMPAMAPAGSLHWMRPLAENLERFRSVVAP